jgi:hypothetical protein
VLDAQAPYDVRVDGAVLPRLDSATALQGAAQGWTFTGAPFGGVLIKLATPSGGAHVDVDTFPTVTAPVGGTVAATLALTLGSPASFGAFVPGVAKTYTATTTANVISTAGDATLTVSDPSTTAPGHLVNGTFVLPQPLQAGGTPLPAVVRTWAAPVSNDLVTLEFEQPIAATDPLRTGSYSKTLTFTLSTTSP